MNASTTHTDTYIRTRIKICGLTREQDVDAGVFGRHPAFAPDTHRGLPGADRAFDVGDPTTNTHKGYKGGWK